MSENVIIALIVVGGVVILGIAALYFLRDRIGSGSISASKDGVQASMQAHETVVSSVSGNKIKGRGNRLGMANAVKVNENEVDGDKNNLGGQ